MLEGFSDPLIDDKNTKERFRADKLMEALNAKIIDDQIASMSEAGILEKYQELYQKLSEDEQKNYSNVFYAKSLVIKHLEEKRLDILKDKYGVNNLVPESWTPEQQHAFMIGEKVEIPNN
jgi:hypothetical protein